MRFKVIVWRFLYAVVADRALKKWHSDWHQHLNCRERNLEISDRTLCDCIGCIATNVQRSGQRATVWVK